MNNTEAIDVQTSLKWPADPHQEQIIRPRPWLPEGRTARIKARKAMA